MRFLKYVICIICLGMILSACKNVADTETQPEAVAASLILRYEEIIRQQEQQIEDLLASAETDTSIKTKPETEPSTSPKLEPETKPITEPATVPDPVQDPESETTPYAESHTEFLWETVSDGIRITGVKNAGDTLTVPSSINGLPVKTLGDRCFSGISSKHVTIEDGICSIGWFAFYGCSELSDIRIPDSVHDIGYAAFDGCSEHITIHCRNNCYAKRFADSFAIPCRTDGY